MRVHTMIRNALVVVMFVAVFGLLIAKPFLPQSIQAQTTGLISMITVLGFGAILLYNRLALGVFFRGRRIADQ